MKEHKNEITQLPGMGVKSVDKLLDSIEKSRTVTLDRFITALGIPNIGSSAAKAISKQFNGDHYDFVQALANGYDFRKLMISEKLQISQFMIGGIAKIQWLNCFLLR